MTVSFAGKLYHQLHYCANFLQRGHGSKKEHQNHDLHRGQGRTLSLLNKNNGISQSALAELLHIRPPSLGELLNKLETNNLIERRQHETDKRVSNVFITDAGRATVAQIEAMRKTHVEALFAGLSIDEQSNLSDLLDKLLETLKTNLDETDDDDRHEHHHGHHHHKRHNRHEFESINHDEIDCKHRAHTTHHIHHEKTDN